MVTTVPSKPTFVTQPFLPPLDEFVPYLQDIWNSRLLTNGAKYHQQFESALGKFIDVTNVSLVTNATLGLITTLQALRIGGEVITPPFTFVASTHAIHWNGIKPVFVDIEPSTCNIDVKKIEAMITPKTTAILGVHCYGNPCDTEAIQAIADTYGLKVVYDAAHAFGVRWKGKSLVDEGDASILSFHATKVFNTFEGGAIIAQDPKLKARIDFLKNFGFANETTVVAPGINGKMNEFQAALGLLQLRYVEAAVARRGEVFQRYSEGLASTQGIHLLENVDGAVPNFSYAPILVERDYPLSRDDLYARLRDHGIFARRYFYPLVSNMPMYRELPSAAPNLLPVANQIANKVLCLPIYPDLSAQSVDRIINLIAS